MTKYHIYGIVSHMRESVVVLNSPVEERILRIEKALEVQDNYGIDIVASGGFTDEDLQEINRELSSRNTGSLIPERNSRETLGNGLWTTTDILIPNDIELIRLVTSDYHIDRARWIFSTVTNGSVRIENHPVKSPYDDRKQEELFQKERLFIAIGGVALYKCDFRSAEGYEKAKKRVQFLFRNRYKD